MPNVQDKITQLNFTLVDTMHKINKNEQKHKDLIVRCNSASTSKLVDFFLEERNIVPLTIKDLIEKDWELKFYSDKHIELFECFGFDTSMTSKTGSLQHDVNSYMTTVKYKPNIVTVTVPMTHITLDDLNKEIIQVNQNFYWINDLLVYHSREAVDTVKELFNDLYNARVEKYQLEILLNDTKDKLFKLGIEQSNKNVNTSNSKPLTKKDLLYSEWYMKGYSEATCNHLETMFKLASKPLKDTSRCMVKHYGYSDTVNFMNPDNMCMSGYEIIFKDGNLYSVDDALYTSPTPPMPTPPEPVLNEPDFDKFISFSETTNTVRKFLITITRKLLSKLENNQ